jgi:hypothetical protein
MNHIDLKLFNEYNICLILLLIPEIFMFKVCPKWAEGGAFSLVFFLLIRYLIGQ